MTNTVDTPLFELHNAQVVRHDKTILHVDALCIATGEHVAVLGPNGAGKSTLIRVLTREIAPLWRDDPPVRFKGAARPLLGDIRASVAVVSSTTHDQVRVHLPVVQIVAGGLYGTVGLPLGRVLDEVDRTAACEALQRVGLVGVEEQDATTLSSGQLRRVLIARELVRNPQVIVFDEPCTGLDPEGMYHVRLTMRELAASGHTIVLVTHHPEDIVPEIGRVLLVCDAHIVGDGDKSDLLRSDVISELFGVPLCVVCDGGWYAIRPGE